MTVARLRNRLTSAMRKHLDGQMTDVLLLGREIEHPLREYPDHVWRAMRLAYAMHYRTLFEFFHNGRGKRQPSAPPPRKRDMIVADVLRSEERRVGKECRS